MWRQTVLACALACSLVRCALLTDEGTTVPGTMDGSDERAGDDAGDARADVSCDPEATPSYCPTSCQADLGNPYCDQGTWRCWTSQSDWNCRGSAPTCPDPALAYCSCNGMGINNDPSLRMIWQCHDAGVLRVDGSSTSDALAEAADATDATSD